MLLPLAACSSLDSWTGDDEDADGDEKAEVSTSKEGRFTVLSTKSAITTDASMQAVEVEWPSPSENTIWSQRGGDAGNAITPRKVSGFKEANTATIGDGSGWETVLTTAPVIGNNTVYAMDARGYISAHNMNDIDDVYWVSKAAVTPDDEEMLGGGLAVAGEQLFVTTGQGQVFSLNAKDGSVIWKR
ncbi:MAG: PQQ-binding-like beta-propeller repeat protein, partial [Rickettsiales bacterium]